MRREATMQFFWEDLDEVLAAVADMDDADAETILIDFLEDYRRMWPSVAAAFRGNRRVLVERAVRILEAG